LGMTLWKRALLIVSLTLAVLVVTLYVFAQITFMTSISDLEAADTRQNVEKVQKIVIEEIADLDTTVSDWAAWDDTYAFVEDANDAYITANLVDSTFSGLRANLMLFVNSSGQLVYGKAFDLQQEEAIPLPEGIAEHIAPNAPLVQHADTESAVNGLILLPEGPMLVASRPILTSGGEGPIRGSLIMGRYLDSAELERLAQLSSLPLTQYLFADEQLPADFQAVKGSLSPESPIEIQPLDDTTIAGYILLTDLYGNPALVLRAEMSRSIYAEGQTAMRYFVALILTVGVVFSALILLLLANLVLSPLSKLNTSVKEISVSGDHSARVPKTGKDELGELAEVINSMLESLEGIQRALRDSEEKYRSIAENSRDVIMLTQPDGIISYLSPASTAVLGYDPDDLVGKQPWIIHPDDLEMIRKSHYQALQGESGANIEYRIKTKSGETKWVSHSWSPIFSAGKLRLIVSIVRDITERKLAVETLRESEEKYRALVESTEDSVYLIDHQCRYLFVNEKHLARLGLSSEGIVGKSYAEFHTEEETKELTEDVERVVQTERSAQHEHRSQRDGHFFLRTLSPVKDAAGRIMAVTVISKDITRLKLAENERKILISELEVKNRVLEQFTYTVSHDLRSPLVTIQGFADMLIRDIEQQDSAKALRDLQYVINAATKMDELIRATLELSRIGRIANPPEDVPFKEIANEAVLQTAGELQAAGIELSVAEEFPTVHVDRMRIGEVLVNLITNSVHYRGEQPHPKIEIGYQRQNGEDVFFVKDNGIGIDKSEQEKVFELFYKVNKSSKGTGMGLAIVKRIIEVHGGRIWIESEKGKGTTVYFTLPGSS
jgi:PAS domain S-box-containing protein